MPSTLRVSLVANAHYLGISEIAIVFLKMAVQNEECKIFATLWYPFTPDDPHVAPAYHGMQPEDMRSVESPPRSRRTLQQSDAVN
jgi:hypothetical protein